MGVVKRLHICDQPHNNWLEYIYSKHEPYSPHNSKHMFDVYSLTHIFWPLLLVTVVKITVGSSFITLLAVYIFFALFELYENSEEQIVKYHRVEIDSQGVSSYRGDSTLNIVGDLLFNAVGVYLSYILTTQTSVLVLIANFVLVSITVGVNYWTDLFMFLKN